jgi:hypothetical protein
MGVTSWAGMGRPANFIDRGELFREMTPDDWLLFVSRTALPVPPADTRSIQIGLLAGRAVGWLQLDQDVLP